MSKVTFHGLPAWIGAIHGPTNCDWWNRDPAQLNWNRSLLYSVDLSKTPSAAIAGYIKVSEIEVDDHVSRGGQTTVGPLWPHGNSVGACWVSDRYLAKLSSHVPKVPSGGNGHDYEYTTIQYFDGEQQNRRFHGFHAHVLQVHNHLSLIEVWHPGTGAGAAKPAGTWWLDLGANADPSTPALAANQSGAVFLEAKTARQLGTNAGKLPPYQGGFAIPA
jgi:hypothetical protein